MSVTIRWRKPRDQWPNDIEVVDGHGRVIRTLNLNANNMNELEGWIPLIRDLMGDAYRQGRRDLQKEFQKLVGMRH